MRTRYNGVESGGAASVAAGDITDVGATGEALVQAATAAAALSTLGVERRQTLDLSAATYENGSVGGGSASHVSGVARLAIGATGTCEYTGGASSAPRARLTLPTVTNAWRIRVAARLAVVGSGGSGANIWHAVLGAKHGAEVYGAHLRVAFDGRPDLCQRTSGSQVATGVPSAVAIDGTGWVALEYDKATVRVLYGTGSGTTPPTSWTVLYESAPLRALLGITQPAAGGGGTAAPSPPTEVYLALDRTTEAGGSAAQVDLGPVLLWELGP